MERALHCGPSPLSSPSEPSRLPRPTRCAEDEEIDSDFEEEAELRAAEVPSAVVLAPQCSPVAFLMLLLRCSAITTGLGAPPLALLHLCCALH